MRSGGVYEHIKRGMDIVIGVVAMPFLAIVILFVAIAIKLDDGGPVFYKSKRIGKNSRIFDMLKFRSMIVDAPNWTNPDGSTYNASDDDRVTKVGKLIRKTSIDELPQFVNILIGDMSFIGPRASGASALSSYQPDEVAKMNVRPGMTGYTQAYFRNDLTVREKRLYDAWYAEHMTFGLDVKIFFKSFATVFREENIYTNAAGISKEDLWIDDGSGKRNEQQEEPTAAK